MIDSLRHFKYRREITESSFERRGAAFYAQQWNPLRSVLYAQRLSLETIDICVRHYRWPSLPNGCVFSDFPSLKSFSITMSLLLRGPFMQQGLLAHGSPTVHPLTDHLPPSVEALEVYDCYEMEVTTALEHLLPQVRLVLPKLSKITLFRYRDNDVGYFDADLESQRNLPYVDRLLRLCRKFSEAGVQSTFWDGSALEKRLMAEASAPLSLGA